MAAKELRGLEGGKIDNKYFILDGGFVQVVENHITILAYHAEDFSNTTDKQIEDILQEADELLAKDANARLTNAKKIKRADLLRELLMIKTMENSP